MHDDQITIIKDPDDAWVENSVLDRKTFCDCLNSGIFTPGTVVKIGNEIKYIAGKPAEIPGGRPKNRQYTVRSWSK